jgi:hypothetical protein
MNNEDLVFAIHTFSAWKIIFTKETGREPTAADITHSALLRWMLLGNEPLKHPPPRMYSYPNHELGSGAKVKVVEFYVLDTGQMKEGRNIVINQYLGWRWQDEGDGLLLHVRSGEIYKLTEENGDRYIQKASHVNKPDNRQGG